jgi:phage repressor protein C with HTH and peptisase S24 domain
MILTPTLLRRAPASDTEVTMRLPLFAAAVRGASMVPTLRSGDLVLALRTRRARAGHVVIARFAARPGLVMVKRVARPVENGFWLLGDNPFGSDDSRVHGPGEVLGRVVLRYWPRPRLIRRTR